MDRHLLYDFRSARFIGYFLNLALLLVDAILTTYTPANQILSSNDVKGIAGTVFGVIAVLIFVKAFVRTKQ
jgi:positive regulator of sigma E activity